MRALREALVHPDVAVRRSAVPRAAAWPDNAHHIWLFCLLDVDATLRVEAGSHLFSYHPVVPDLPATSLVLDHLHRPLRSLHDLQLTPAGATDGPWKPAIARGNKRRALVWVLDWLGPRALRAARGTPAQLDDDGLGVAEVLLAARHDRHAWVREIATRISRT